MNEAEYHTNIITKTDIENIQQLAVFFTGNDATYAINISKVKAFIITEETAIDYTPTENKIIAGIATIRGEPITLLNLDVWLGNLPLSIDEYKLIIFCEFNNKQVGILIKDMLNIIEKNSSELNFAENQNSKIIYTTYVKVNEKEQLCTVFNAEKLMEDIGWIDQNIPYAFEPIPLNNKKYVLIADDSQMARQMTSSLLDKMNQKYELYNNGEELLKGMETIDPKEIGIIIIDIEMPLLDGYQVTKHIKGDNRYSHIPIIVNSSMANDAIRDKMEKIGVDGFIAKPNLKLMYEIIKEKILN
jgi:two-component system chemotaxis response regulator CheV